MDQAQEWETRQLEDELVADLPGLLTYYNLLYFDNLLGPTTVEWSSKRMTRCGGTTQHLPGGGCLIKLSEPLLKFYPIWRLKDVLLHEAIHAWLMLQGIRERNGGHGRRFLMKAEEINTSLVPDQQRPPQGYHIAQYHTMYDGVEYHQQHQWKCLKCEKVIKRAMNREPQPADCPHYRKDKPTPPACTDPRCGYHAHVRDCGGEWDKIQTPEGYVDKSKAARQQDGKRRRKHDDKTRSIKEFFKGGGGHRLGSTDAVGASFQPAEGELSRREMRRRMADAATARLPQTAMQAEPSHVESRGANCPEAAARQRNRIDIDLTDDELFKPSAHRFRGERPQQLTAGGAEQQVWDKKGEGKHGAVADQHTSGSAGKGTSLPHSKQSDAGMSSAVVPTSTAAIQAPVSCPNSAVGPTSTAAIQAPVSCPNCGQPWLMITNEDLNRHLDNCLDSAKIVLDIESPIYI